MKMASKDRRLVLLTVATLWVAAASAAALRASDEAPRPEAAIRAAGDAMCDALRKGDVERLLATYTPDARLVMVGRTVQGHEEIRGFLEFALAAGVRDVRVDEQELFLGEGVAVETGRATFLGVTGAKLATSRYMTLWKETDGRWRVHRDLGVPAPGGVSAQAAPPGAVSFAVKQVEPSSVVVLPMTGSFGQHGEAIARVAVAAGDAVSGPPFGLYYNSPDSVGESELRWEVGFPVSPDCQVDAPLERRDLPAGTVAFAIASGPHDAPHPWTQLTEWVISQGYEITGPAMEIWMSGPRTEMRFAVRKSASE
jgi:uncharacterized protein (TIGR02246 family)